MPDQAPPPPAGWDELRKRPVPAEHEYLVVGHRDVYGVKPGEIGILSLTPDQEHDLIEAGHIVPVVDDEDHDDSHDESSETEAAEAESDPEDPGQSPN